MVFSKSYCPYCKITKLLLDSYQNNIDYSVAIIELDEQQQKNINDGQIIQNALQDLTGQSTVPNVFINGKHIGGNSHVQELLDSGDLENLLRQAVVDSAQDL